MKLRITVCINSKGESYTQMDWKEVSPMSQKTTTTKQTNKQTKKNYLTLGNGYVLLFSFLFIQYCYASHFSLDNTLRHSPSIVCFCLCFVTPTSDLKTSSWKRKRGYFLDYKNKSRDPSDMLFLLQAAFVVYF